MDRELDRLAEDLQEAVLAGYPEKLKAEFLKPGHVGKIESPDSQVSVTGPCGDTIEMCLSIRNGRISEIKFMTDGCGTTIACANYVSRMAKGKSIQGALRIKPEEVDSYFEGLPEENRHCADLAVMTLTAALAEFGKRNANRQSNG